MKYLYPKKITIGTNEFDIVFDKNHGGGSFQYPKNKSRAKIVIGTRDFKADNGDVLNIIIHEISEILHVEMGHRFNYSDNLGNYLFSYDHRGFSTHTAALAGILKQFIK